MIFSNRVPPEARAAYNRDATSGMLGAVMTGLTGPFVGVIARKTLHASALEVAVLSMAPVLGSGLSLVWARAMEGRRKVPFVVWPAIIGRSLFFLAIFARTSIAFVAIVAATNFISSISGPAYSAVMKELYPDSDRGRIMGYVRVCMVAVMIIVTACAAPLLKMGDNYRYAFPLAGLFGVMASFVFRKIPSTATDGDADVPVVRFVLDGIMVLRHDPGFRWFCGGTFLFGFANFMAAPIYTIYQVDIGVDEIWAGAFSIINLCIMMVAYFYWGGYIDRRRPEGVVALQTLCWSSIPLIYCFAGQPWMLLPAFVVMGVVGAGCELSYFVSVLHYAPEGRLTQYQAIFTTLTGLRGVVAPLIGAALLHNGILSMKSIFIVASAMILISVVVQVVGMRKYPTPKPTC